MLIIIKYKQLALDKLLGIKIIQEGFFSDFKENMKFLIEGSIILFHLPPSINYVWTGDFLGNLWAYNINAIFSLACLVKFYFAINLFNQMSRWTSDTSFSVCRKNLVRTGLIFSIKCEFKKRPFYLTTILFVFFVSLCSFLLRTFEFGVKSEGDTEFIGNNPLQSIWNCIHFMFFTVTKVGYGRIVPLSILGRSISIIASIIGNLIIALFIASVAVISEFTNAESKAYKIIKRLKADSNLKEKASLVIKNVFLLRKVMSIKYTVQKEEEVKDNKVDVSKADSHMITNDKRTKRQSILYFYDDANKLEKRINAMSADNRDTRKNNTIQDIKLKRKNEISKIYDNKANNTIEIFPNKDSINNSIQNSNNRSEDSKQHNQNNEASNSGSNIFSKNSSSINNPVNNSQPSKSYSRSRSQDDSESSSHKNKSIERNSPEVYSRLKLRKISSQYLKDSNANTTKNKDRKEVNTKVVKSFNILTNKQLKRIEISESHFTNPNQSSTHSNRHISFFDYKKISKHVMTSLHNRNLNEEFFASTLNITKRFLIFSQMKSIVNGFKSDYKAAKSLSMPLDDTFKELEHDVKENLTKLHDNVEPLEDVDCMLGDILSEQRVCKDQIKEILNMQEAISKYIVNHNNFEYRRLQQCLEKNVKEDNSVAPNEE